MVSTEYSDKELDIFEKELVNSVTEIVENFVIEYEIDKNFQLTPDELDFFKETMAYSILLYKSQLPPEHEFTFKPKYLGLIPGIRTLFKKWGMKSFGDIDKAVLERIMRRLEQKKSGSVRMGKIFDSCQRIVEQYRIVTSQEELHTFLVFMENENNSFLTS